MPLYPYAGAPRVCWAHILMAAATTPVTTAPRPSFLQAAGRVLRGALTGLLTLLGLTLAAMCLGRFAVVGAGSAAAPVWLGAAAAAEQLAGAALLGSRYVLWDGFTRALGLALLSSLCLGLAAWTWPRRRQLRRAAVSASLPRRGAPAPSGPPSERGRAGQGDVDQGSVD